MDLFLFIHFILEDFFPLIVFAAVWVLTLWFLAIATRKYLSAPAVEGVPFPLWMQAIMAAAAFFPAFLIASFT